MSLFQYPKTTHKRSLSPRVFKRYQTYKRYLQWEFGRICVYCRQPDSSAPNLNFGADHYRPKSIPRFAHLMCEYKNLYYCCGQCNSRKNNEWPLDEKKGPFVVNPCDHDMASHLRFSQKTGQVDAMSVYGRYTADLLQLNDDATVQWRQSTLLMVSVLEARISDAKEAIEASTKKLKSGQINQAAHDSNVSQLSPKIAELQRALEMLAGTGALAPLRKKRGSVILIP